MYKGAALADRNSLSAVVAFAFATEPAANEFPQVAMSVKCIYKTKKRKVLVSALREDLPWQPDVRLTYIQSFQRLPLQRLWLHKFHVRFAQVLLLPARAGRPAGCHRCTRPGRGCSVYRRLLFRHRTGCPAHRVVVAAAIAAGAGVGLVHNYLGRRRH